MNRPTLTIEQLKRKADRAQQEFSNAMQIHKVVTSDLWPDIKAWLERLMSNLYQDARKEDDHDIRAMRMGEWETLRWLIACGMEYQDITAHESKLHEAQNEYLKKITI